MSSDPLKPSYLLKAAGVFNWCLGKSVASLNALGTLLIMAMMLLICTDVVGRNLFTKSLPGVIELVELGIVSIVYLQIADTLKSGKLMRSDALLTQITSRFPLFGTVMNMLFDITGAVLFYFMTMGAFVRLTEAWQGGFYLGNQGSFTVQTWPMELCVTLGSGLMCLLFITNTIGNIYTFLKERSLVNKESLPTTGSSQ